MDDPVEVSISKRCEHEAYTISCGSPAVWRFEGVEPIEAQAEDQFIIRPGGVECECFEDEEVPHGTPTWTA